jgi:hypothetical protein
MRFRESCSIATIFVLVFFFYKMQIVVSLCFTGAELNIVDKGKCKGTCIFEEEEMLGLKLMQLLLMEQQATAQVYKLMCNSAMLKGCWNYNN